MAISNHYINARFTISAQNLNQLPEDTGLEVAFAGRSNTGKSSVINAITRQKQLARVSKTPGRTRLLNCFDIGPDRRIIDLPGYGYAKVPESMKRHWGQVLEAYFQSRQSLKGLILIVDIRHGLKPTDRQMQAWCKAHDLPLHIVLNKADKLSRGAGMKQMHELMSGAGQNQSMQIFSVPTRIGLENLTKKLDELFEW